MTYGPVPKWRFPFHDKLLILDPGKRTLKTFFFLLCTFGVVVLLLFYVSLFPLGGSRFNFSGKLDPLVNVRHFNINTNVGNLEVDTLDDRFYRVSGDNDDAVSEYSATKAPVAQRNGSTAIWEDPRLDILHMPIPEFDNRFQNPCWFEPLTSADPYTDNTYSTYSYTAAQYLDKLTPTWEERYESEVEPRRLRCLPHFLVIGQPKCGSTDLFWKLAKHPDIRTPPVKELHWWSRYRQGRCFSYSKIIPFEDYVDMFDGAALKMEERMSNNSLDTEDSEEEDVSNSQVITGEASVSLFWDNNEWMWFPENQNQREPQYINPHYIHHIIPDVKLILVLREPTDRMYSDYLYFNAANKSADHFHRAAKFAIDTYNNCTKLHGDRECVYNVSVSNRVGIRLRVGMYSIYMKDWLSLFPKQQFFILRLEDYSKDRIYYFKRIYRFLEIRDITPEEEESLFNNRISNTRKHEDRELGGMHEETRQLLDDFYRPYNEQLSKMLQDTRFLWNDIRRDTL